MNIKDYLVQVGYEEENKFLHTKMFDVNMRLFSSSTEYKNIILSTLNSMRRIILSDFEDYTLRGLSGANIGIPFNIIILLVKNSHYPDNILEMINPKIITYSGYVRKHSTNCGSICLPGPILVDRNDRIDVLYYKRDGLLRRNIFSIEEGSLIIQHEVDHGLGKLITD
jgi:peptide deformylase